MGSAISLRNQSESRANYEQWTLENVLALLTEKLPSDIRTHRLDKKDFFGLFNDYSVMLPTGGFLTLPIEEFNRLHLLEAEPTNPQTIPVFRAVLSLALLCEPQADGTESMERRVEVISKAFGEPRKITKSDAGELWSELFLVLSTHGLLAKACSASEQKVVVDICWESIVRQHPGDVDLTTLVAWCANDLRQRGILFKSLTGDVEGTVKMAQDMKILHKKVPDLKKAESYATSSHRYQRARRQTNEVTMQDKRNEGYRQIAESSVHSDAGTVDSAMHAMRVKQRERKRKLNTIATTKALVNLVEQSDLDMTVLLRLREDFTDLLAKSRAPKTSHPRSITSKELESLMIGRFPQLEQGQGLKRAIQVFDVDGDGYIEFDEFVLAISRMSSQDMDRELDFLFKMFDVSGDGQVEMWEVTDMCEDHKKDLQEIHRYCNQVAQTLDTDGDGNVDSEEFANCLKREKIFINFCWAGLAATIPESLTAMTAVRAEISTSLGVTAAKEEDGDMTFAEIQAAPASCTSLTGALLSALVTAEEEIVALVQVQFDDIYDILARVWCTFDKELLRKLFDLVDAEDGSLDGLADAKLMWITIAKALVTIAPVSVERRLKMQTTVLYARAKMTTTAKKNHMTITVTAILNYLADVVKRLDMAMETLVNYFDHLDENHDGKMTHEELLSSVHAKPEVLNLLQCIFFFGV